MIPPNTDTGSKSSPARLAPHTSRTQSLQAHAPKINFLLEEGASEATQRSI
jgi:hypothetical protein